MNALKNSQQALENEKAELLKEKEKLTKEKTELTDKNKALTTEKDKLKQKYAPYEKLEKLYEVFSGVKGCLNFGFVEKTHSAMDLIALEDKLEDLEPLISIFCRIRSFFEKFSNDTQENSKDAQKKRGSA
ncbi:hypothetical protein ACQJ9C_03080 [Helicobacter pylori]